MFTFIVVAAVAAFIPYVAAPGIAKGVKAVTQPPAAMLYQQPSAPSIAPVGSDAANRIVASPGGVETSA